ncbi:MAG: hypothetical protein EXS42_08090 [Lacunisphaera sp.]|nr:hypothetical protein [Lacunisphaera sp.]
MLLGVAMLLISGCDVGLLVKLRSQLRQPQQFFEITSHGDTFTVRFLQPVIHRTSLPALGLVDVDSMLSDTRIAYTLQVNGFSGRRVDVALRFSGDCLQSISMPSIIYEILGRANIHAIMRLAGGANLPEGSLESIPMDRIREALKEEGAGCDPQADSVSIKLAPTMAHTRALVIIIKRRALGENYETINVVFREETDLASSSAQANHLIQM